MTIETTTTKTLIRDIAAALVDHPDAIDINAQETDGGCYYAMKGDPRDDPLLLGRSRTHEIAFQVLVAEFGVADGRKNTFRLITEDGRQDRPRDKASPRDILRYDVEPARLLLGRIIGALAVGRFSIEVGPPANPGRSLTYLFKIWIERDDYPHFWREPVDGPTRGFPLFEAIATLFRAIGKRDGVRFELKLSPK